MEEIKRECGNCRYFEQIGPEIGECHRNPPAANVLLVQAIQGVHPQIHGNWPPVKVGNWCGEFDALERD